MVTFRASQMAATNHLLEPKILTTEDVKLWLSQVRHARIGDLRQYTNMLIIWTLLNQARELKLGIINAEILTHQIQFGAILQIQPQDGNIVSQLSNTDSSFQFLMQETTEATSPLVLSLVHQSQLWHQLHHLNFFTPEFIAKKRSKEEFPWTQATPSNHVMPSAMPIKTVFNLPLEQRVAIIIGAISSPKQTVAKMVNSVMTTNLISINHQRTLYHHQPLRWENWIQPLFKKVPALVLTIQLTTLESSHSLMVNNALKPAMIIQTVLCSIFTLEVIAIFTAESVDVVQIPVVKDNGFKIPKELPLISQDLANSIQD